MRELRWDVLRGEWVVVAGHRQNRTHHPSENNCPLCPDGSAPTPIRFDERGVAVFHNHFPSLSTEPSDLAFALDAQFQTNARAAAYGICDVVVYTPDHDTPFALLSEDHIGHIIKVWQRCYRELSSADGIAQVFIFENRGVEIGVTLTHAHGQIYGYPFVPPEEQKLIARERAYVTEHGQCLHCTVLGEERADGTRVVAQNDDVTVYVPFAARWPYELHIATTRHRASLLDINDSEIASLAKALKQVSGALDALFDRPMPYLMAIKQAATAGTAETGSHLRFEFLPARRAPDKLKFRAGSETFMGVYIADVAPEAAAQRLRELISAQI
jgi:UDPglucose--hexose-1-phosphate uridylyltransferase